VPERLSSVLLVVPAVELSEPVVPSFGVFDEVEHPVKITTVRLAKKVFISLFFIFLILD
jgi:hypothetical protein